MRTKRQNESTENELRTIVRGTAGKKLIKLLAGIVQLAMRHTSLKRILHFSLYLIYLFCVIELILRACLSYTFVGQKLTGFTYNYDLFWRLDWIKRHSTNIEIYYKFDAYDVTKGWRAQSNLHDMQMFNNTVLNTNSRGLRGTSEVPYEKTPGKQRILIFGDSFTFGDDVSDQETYCYYLQQLLPNAEIVNMGVHGYGHDQMLIFLQEEGIKYNPDIVILGFIAADMNRNTLQFRDYAKPRFIVDKNTLQLIGSPVPPPAYFLKWEWANLKSWEILKILAREYGSKLGFKNPNMRSGFITSHILNKFIEVVDDIGAQPLFVHLATGNEMINPALASSGEEFFQQFCQQNKKVHYCSTRKDFLEATRRGTKLMTEGGHWNSAGHWIAANSIKPHLDKLMHIRVGSGNRNLHTLRVCLNSFKPASGSFPWLP
jgi:hypothetical protein